VSSDSIPLPGIRLLDLHGRTALITGGSRGLGLAMAAGLASAGADVMLASRHLEEAEAAASGLAHDFGRRAFGTAADVADAGQVERLVAAATEALGRVDILINSAGINIRGPIAELAPAQFGQVMAVNVTGTWLTCRAVLPGMRAHGWGRIINVASALGLVGLAGRSPYSASKGAVIQLTRTLALEAAADGITVNALCPGPFLTEMNRAIADTEQTRRDLIGATALGRWGRLEEIQAAALFLASPGASYVTGAALPVDGGWTAR